MGDTNIPMAKVYQLVGELYVNNALMSDHITKQAKDLENATNKIAVYERQIKVLEGTAQNGPSQEE